MDSNDAIDDRFASRLDTENDHLIPFRNGVLDLQQLRLRPGRPDDMVSRGPRYPWVDFDAMDADIEDMEMLLTTIFPGSGFETALILHHKICLYRIVRQFFLDVASSFLRRRNRYKHFYVFTTLNMPTWKKMHIQRTG